MRPSHFLLLACAVALALVAWVGVPAPIAPGPSSLLADGSAFQGESKLAQLQSAQAESRHAELSTPERVEAIANEADKVFPTVVPEYAKSVVAYLNFYHIEVPNLSTEDDWRRLILMVEGMRREIVAAGLERNQEIKRVAKLRCMAGNFEEYAFDGQPSRSDPAWKAKWPWLESQPNEQRQMELTINDAVRVARIVRIFPGEDAHLDAAVEKKRSLIETMRLDVVSMGQ